MTNQNRQITLAARPAGFPSESDFKLVATAIPKPTDGECLVQGIYLSVDPYMRGRMRDRASYVAPIQLGEVMGGGAVGRVLESRSDSFQTGDIVEGMLGWQEYAVAPAKTLRKVDPALAPISTALGVLGMPGLTAYFGLLDIADPRSGETVVVSGAAGAVGATVGQIAKIRGCRVVGGAGGDEKVRHLVGELGFDAAFDYKTAKDYGSELKRLCPGGVDVYFDNVGGAITDAVFSSLNVGARVSVCGQISQYNVEAAEMGPRLLWHLIVKRAKAQGFLIFDYASRYEEARQQLAEWVKQGKIRYRERIAEGIENAPKAFLEMMQGKNIGKQLVRLSPE
ncbi:MAG: NADP-dependent oxidoreductase [Bryobacterales bacterium]